MHGAAVRTLQIDLTAAGFKTAEDGVFGATTYAHVIAFQRRFDLRPTGTVGTERVHEAQGSGDRQVDPGHAVA